MRNIRAVFAFFRNVKCFAQQVGRYYGLYVRAIDPPDTQASPPMQVCICSAQERDPEHPQKGPFSGSNSLNNPSFFRKFIFCRTTITDRPVAPWPCHKPDFSNFGSASPKWHSHAEPQRHEFWDGGSTSRGGSARAAAAAATSRISRHFGPTGRPVMPECLRDDDSISAMLERGTLEHDFALSMQALGFVDEPLT